MQQLIKRMPIIVGAIAAVLALMFFMPLLSKGGVSINCLDLIKGQEMFGITVVKGVPAVILMLLLPLAILGVSFLRFKMKYLIGAGLAVIGVIVNIAIMNLKGYSLDESPVLYFCIMGNLAILALSLLAVIKAVGNPATATAAYGATGVDQTMTQPPVDAAPSGTTRFDPARISGAIADSDFMKSMPGYLQVFVKQPFTAVSSGALCWQNGLILAGIHALLFAFMFLAIAGEIRSITYGLGIRAKGGEVFFGALLISLVATAILTGLHALFGKVIFKGEMSNIKDVLPRVVAAEIPLIAATALAIIAVFVSPALTALLLIFGTFFAIVLSCALYMSWFKISPDKSALATVLTYTIQAVVLYQLFSSFF